MLTPRNSPRVSSSSRGGTTPHSLRNDQRLTRVKGQIKYITETYKHYVGIQYTQSDHAARALKDVLTKSRDTWTFTSIKLIPTLDSKDRKLLVLASPVKLKESILHTVYNVCIRFGPIIQMGTEETFGTKLALLAKPQKHVTRSKLPTFALDLSCIKIILYEVAIRLDNDSSFNLLQVSKAFSSTVNGFFHSQAFWKAKLEWLYQTKEKLPLYEVNWVAAFNIFNTLTPNKAARTFVCNYEIFCLSRHLGSNLSGDPEKLKKLILTSVVKDSPKVLDYLLRIYLGGSFPVKLLEQVITKISTQKVVGRCECIDVVFKLYRELNYPGSTQSYSELLSPEEQAKILTRGCDFSDDTNGEALVVSNYLIDVIQLDPFSSNNLFLVKLIKKDLNYSFPLIRKLLLDPRLDLSLNDYVVVRSASEYTLALILKLCKLDINKVDLTEKISQSTFFQDGENEYEEGHDLILLLTLNVTRRINLSKYLKEVSYKHTNPYTSRHEVEIKQLIGLDPFLKRRVENLARASLAATHTS
jgi:hypothetical protein